MSWKARALLTGAVVAFIVSGLRFLPRPPLSTDFTDFAAGLGVGFLIGVVVIWAGERTPRA